MRHACLLLAALPLACRSVPPDNTETIEALIADGKQRPLSQVARSVQDVALKMPARSGVYRIGAKDVLRVHVAGHPEFGVLEKTAGGDLVGVRVQADGKLYLPLVGGVEAAGRTTLELQAELNEKLEKYLKEPFVSVDVLHHESQRFYLLGAFQNPGVYPVRERTTLLDAFGRAGGIHREADLHGGYVLHGTTLLPVSLFDLLQRGDMAQNIHLEDGDFVYLPLAEEAEVYVLGEVRRPGPVPMKRSGLNLSAAIATAQGIDPIFARRHEITIFRGDWGKPKAFTVSIDDVYRYGASIPLKPHDRIVVAPRGLATWNRTLSLMLPFLQNPITAGALTASVTN